MKNLLNAHRGTHGRFIRKDLFSAGLALRDLPAEMGWTDGQEAASREERVKGASFQGSSWWEGAWLLSVTTHVACGEA